MGWRIKLSSTVLLAWSIGGWAQTTVTTTGGGIAGSIPYFTGNSDVEQSIITQSPGTVNVNGGFLVSGTIGAGGEIESEGVGLGFRVLGSPTDRINQAPWYGLGMSNLSLWQGGQNAVQIGGYFWLNFQTGNGMMVIRGDNGNVGIGTSTPGASLEVNGSVKLTSGSGASLTFPDGTVQSTAYTGTTCPTGGDYAESVDVTGDKHEYEPGDVMVIDPSHPGHFLKSSEPYSTLVAGIYSTKPGFVGRRQTTDPKTSTTEIPMAMVGVVPTKVSAENGPIKVGDLLVTSSTRGYVMKGTDRNVMVGAVVGKALAKLDNGTGTIEVLVSLQ